MLPFADSPLITWEVYWKKVNVFGESFSYYLRENDAKALQVFSNEPISFYFAKNLIGNRLIVNSELSQYIDASNYFDGHINAFSHEFRCLIKAIYKQSPKLYVEQIDVDYKRDVNVASVELSPRDTFKAVYVKLLKKVAYQYHIINHFSDIYVSDAIAVYFMKQAAETMLGMVIATEYENEHFTSDALAERAYFTFREA